MERETQKLAIHVYNSGIDIVDKFGLLFERFKDKIQSFDYPEKLDKFCKNEFLSSLNAFELSKGYWIWEGRQKIMNIRGQYKSVYRFQGNWRKATNSEKKCLDKGQKLWESRLKIEKDSSFEKVAVVDESLVEDIIQTDEPIVRDFSSKMFDKWIENIQFRYRNEETENDETVKQIIPYVLVRSGNRYFSMRRKLEQSEERLHDLRSLGVGGHIPEYVWVNQGEDIIEAGMYKELHEEINIDCFEEPETIGIIYDDSNDVGKYHIGVVYLIESDLNVSVREKDKMEGAFQTKEEIAKTKHEYEAWSQILIDDVILN